MGKPEWATLDPDVISGQHPAVLQNLVNGKWVDAKESTFIIDPLNGEKFVKMPKTSIEELGVFVKSLNSCPKSGLFNIYKNPEKYSQWGQICFRLARELAKEEIETFFTRCIQRVCPKSFPQAKGEVTVTRVFLQNFSGDNVRFTSQGFVVPGDHLGQRSNGLRWPYGPVVVISPFNFPLEIPVLQIMGALMMGNKVTLKCASTTSLVMEQWVRLMHYCGAPMENLDFINCSGSAMGEFIKLANPRMMQFTGSSDVAEKLAADTKGKIKIEDAGFDWKILGPDVDDVEYVAWQCDQDAFASTGQKCSAQSMLFMHENWMKVNLPEKLKQIASKRKLDDLTIAPVLSHTTAEMKGHIEKCLKLNGAKIVFGGEELKNHHIPPVYGALCPTCVFVPLDEIMKNEENFKLCTTEIFGPFYILTEWKDNQLDLVLNALEKMNQHLTAAIVSKDMPFIHKCLGSTVNGTTYVGIKARTTGAPQNHWFGPAGDPRAAGIGSPYAICLVWTCHREVIEDFGPVSKEWKIPNPT